MTHDPISVMFTIIRIDNGIAYFHRNGSIYKKKMTLSESSRWFVGDEVWLVFEQVSEVY